MRQFGGSSKFGSCQSRRSLELRGRGGRDINVVGTEERDYLVEAANANLRKCGISDKFIRI